MKKPLHKLGRLKVGTAFRISNGSRGTGTVGTVMGQEPEATLVKIKRQRGIIPWSRLIYVRMLGGPHGAR